MSEALVALWEGTGAFSLRTLPLPEPGPGEVLVAIRLAGICGSDRHTVSGRRNAPCPSVLGHESVGEVVAVGAGASDVHGEALLTGQRVVWTVTVSCGRCDRCISGLGAKCRTVRKVGHEPFTGDWPLSGGYASHILLPRGTGIVRVPDALPDRAAALTSCAVATAVACVETAERMRGTSLAGARVLVVGAGALGISACAALAMRGCTSIAIADPDDTRAQQGLAFGATHRALADELVDVAIDFSGVSAGVAHALDCLDLAGVLVLAGTVTPGHTIPLDPDHVVRQYLRIAGVHNYEPQHLARAVDLLAGTAQRGWESLTEPPVGLDQLGTRILEAPADSRILRRSVAP